MPTISVIVPVYKVEKYIHRCVDSILGQTFRDFELILVDDGSPDNCGAICDEYTAKDSRIHVIHQANGGLSAARNAGIDWAFANSDSEWLTFIDSDDWVHPQYLAVLYHAVTECNTFISCCGITTEPFLNTPLDYCPEKYETEEAYTNRDIKFNSISSCAKLYYKELWKDVRFPVGKIHEDRFTTHKLLFQAPEIANINLQLYHYFINKEGITHSQWTPRRMDDVEAVEKQLQYFKRHNQPKAYVSTAKSGFYAVYGMIQEIETDAETVGKYKRYIRILRQKLRRYLRKQGMLLDRTNPISIYFYEAAYPRAMKWYWYGIAVLRKLGIRK